MAFSNDDTPSFVVVDGLDGVGKSTVVHQLALMTGGVDVASLVAHQVSSCDDSGLTKEGGAAQRYEYWLNINRLAGQTALAVLATGRTAIVDSYVFRTIATHRVQGVNINSLAALRSVVRPDRAAMLTLSEDVRLARLANRDNGAESEWHAYLRHHRGDVLRSYQQFFLAEVDTSGSPQDVAEYILKSEECCNFWFGE
jgi:thymidylate kinase